MHTRSKKHSNAAQECITQEQLDTIQNLTTKKNQLIGVCSAPYAIAAWTTTYFILEAVLKDKIFNFKNSAITFRNMALQKYGRDDANKYLQSDIALEDFAIFSKVERSTFERYSYTHLLGMIVFPFSKPLFNAISSRYYRGRYYPEIENKNEYLSFSDAKMKIETLKKETSLMQKIADRNSKLAKMLGYCLIPLVVLMMLNYDPIDNEHEYTFSLITLVTIMADLSFQDGILPILGLFICVLNLAKSSLYNQYREIQNDYQIQQVESRKKRLIQLIPDEMIFEPLIKRDRSAIILRVNHKIQKSFKYCELFKNILVDHGMIVEIDKINSALVIDQDSINNVSDNKKLKRALQQSYDSFINSNFLQSQIKKIAKALFIEYMIYFDNDARDLHVIDAYIKLDESVEDNNIEQIRQIFSGCRISLHDEWLNISGCQHGDENLLDNFIRHSKNKQVTNLQSFPEADNKQYSTKSINKTPTKISREIEANRQPENRVEKKVEKTSTFTCGIFIPSAKNNEIKPINKGPFAGKRFLISKLKDDDLDHSISKKAMKQLDSPQWANGRMGAEGIVSIKPRWIKCDRGHTFFAEAKIKMLGKNSQGDTRIYLSKETNSNNEMLYIAEDVKRKAHKL